VLVNETWVFASGSNTKVGTNGTSQCARKWRPASTRNEFVSGASLIIVSGTKSGDYHDTMNGENFEHWVLTQLLPNLEEPSLVIMDNASYHSVLLNKPPTQSWRKDHIIAWLQEDSFKAKLLNLANAYKSPRKRRVSHFNSHCNSEQITPGVYDKVISLFN
jgi:hypothetical protein